MAGALILACLFAYSTDKPLFTIATETLETAETQYGADAKARLLYWQSLVRDNQTALEHKKLLLVNDFFNQARFIDDQELWAKKDYWATPVEFLGRDAGDCEDYSIAKYFTLMELGVPTEKLRITYTKSLTYNQAHMVLAYYETPSSMPLILDNINKRIKPASERPDLKPIYSFNADNLWLNRSRNVQLKAGKPGRLKLWRDLEARMELDESK